MSSERYTLKLALKTHMQSATQIRMTKQQRRFVHVQLVTRERNEQQGSVIFILWEDGGG